MRIFVVIFIVCTDTKIIAEMSSNNIIFAKTAQRNNFLNHQKEQRKMLNFIFWSLKHSSTTSAIIFFD